MIDYHFAQVSGSVHKNGNIAGNGNTGSVSPRNQGDAASRKRLSDQNPDTCGKKRRVIDGEQQATQVDIRKKKTTTGMKI